MAGCLLAQTTPRSVKPFLEAPVQTPEVTEYQVRQFIVARIPRLKLPATAAEWTAEASRLRERALNQVFFHGWPPEWVGAGHGFEDHGLIPAGQGYRLRKFRYPIVPGFYTTALLYEPEGRMGKTAAILNLNGHEPEGKSTEYIQKRCINQARQGYYALNLEWIGMGELAARENLHYWSAHVDLAGMAGSGLFYIAMRKGLDFLASHPGVDPARIGVTGLSGGGWQTAVLSGLDPRVAVAIPNAGYLSGLNYGGREGIGDNEQSATDLLSVLDYAHITAMRAPRPTLLIYNAEDNCCFRAPRIRPFLFEPVLPFFALYAAAKNLEWYENLDPGDHNYQLDNRMQSYRFFSTHLGMPPVTAESPAGADIKPADQLKVGLPDGQLTLFEVGRRQAMRIRHDDVAPAGRGERRGVLRRVLRYRPVGVEAAYVMTNSNSRGLETVGWRFDFTNGLSASGVMLRATTAPAGGPAIVVLHDGGRAEASAIVSDHVNRGATVLALDTLFTGSADTIRHPYPVHDRMLACIGERALGLRAAQLAAVTGWLAARYNPRELGIDATGPRSQVLSLTAGALDPGRYRFIRARDGWRSLGRIYEDRIEYQKCPELFCLDLFKEFDIGQLAALTETVADH